MARALSTTSQPGHTVVQSGQPGTTTGMPHAYTVILAVSAYWPPIVSRTLLGLQLYLPYKVLLYWQVNLLAGIMLCYARTGGIPLTMDNPPVNIYVLS